MIILRKLGGYSLSLIVLIVFLFYVPVGYVISKIFDPMRINFKNFKE